MPSTTEHTARINDPNKYEKIRRVNDEFGSGINVLYGVLASGKTEVQSIHFDADKFSAAEARKWLKDHDYKPIEFVEASGKSMNGGLCFKNFKIEVKEAREVKEASTGKKYGIIKGYASTYGNIDRYNDIVEKGAFAKCLNWFRQEGKKMPICWQHNLDMPIGGVDMSKIYEDDKGLFIAEGKLYIDDIPKAKEVYTFIKEGIVSEMSFGYMINKATPAVADDQNVTLLQELFMYEVSPVVVPANTMAKINECKSFGNDLEIAEKNTEWNESAALQRVTAYFGAPDSAYLHEKSFPFADVIDGKLKAVPNAIFQIASKLQKNEFDINYQVAIKLKSKLSKYYDKMGIDCPFKGVDIEGTITKNDVYDIIGSDRLSLADKKYALQKMMQRGTLSKRAAQIIVERFNFEVSPQKASAPEVESFLLKELRSVAALIENADNIDNKKLNDKLLLDELNNIKKLI